MNTKLVVGTLTKVNSRAIQVWPYHRFSCVPIHFSSITTNVLMFCTNLAGVHAMEGKRKCALHDADSAMENGVLLEGYMAC